VNRTTSFSRVVALTLVLVLAERWQLVTFLAPKNATPLLFIVSGLWLALMLASIVGLFQHQRWGVWSLIALVPVSTILHGIPLIPFATAAFPLEMRPFVMTAANILVLLVALVLHKAQAKSPARESLITT